MIMFNGRMKTAITALSLGVALFSGAANAEFSVVDWQEEGDSNIAQDSETGLDWLRLTNTQGMSINEVVDELGEGGDFEGWRLATSTEVQTMIENVYPQFDFSDDEGTTVTYSKTYTGGSDYYSALRTTWAETLGLRYYTTSSGSNRYWTGYGLYLNDEANAESLADNEVLMSGFGYRKSDGGQANQYKYYAYIHNDYSHADYSTDYSNASYGVYLVSDEPMSYLAVPVSGAFMASLFLVGASIRRKRQVK
jgi:hypothetical protein